MSIDSGEKWQIVSEKNICIHIFIIIFNLMCTYHAVSPPGSEQERLEYALNNKRRALILALRWANTHSYLLQEEPAALSFLEVNLNQLWAAVKKYYSNCVKVKKKKNLLILFSCRSCMEVYQMIPGCWELWKTLFQTWRKSSNYSKFLINFFYVHVLVLFILILHIIYYLFSSEEAKATKKVNSFL